MKFAIVIFFITTTLYAENFSHSVALKEGKILSPANCKDFKKLNALMKKSAMAGFPCMQGKLAELRQSKSEQELKSMSIQEQKKLQKQYIKECLCSSSSSEIYRGMNNILSKHSDWIGQTITCKKQGGSSASIDLKSIKQVIDNFNTTCIN